MCLRALGSCSSSKDGKGDDREMHIGRDVMLISRNGSGKVNGNVQSIDDTESLG